MASKSPTHRRCKTGVKPTRKEHDERVMEVGRMAAQGYSRFKIQAIITKKYEVCWQTVQNYISHAKKMLLEAIARDKQELRAESYDFYVAIKNDKKSTSADRIRAQQRIDELLGLEAPKQHEVAGPMGGPVQIDSKVQEVKVVLHRFVNGMEVDCQEQKQLESGNGNGHGTIEVVSEAVAVPKEKL